MRSMISPIWFCDGLRKRGRISASVGDCSVNSGVKPSSVASGLRTMLPRTVMPRSESASTNACSHVLAGSRMASVARTLSRGATQPRRCTTGQAPRRSVVPRTMPLRDGANRPVGAGAPGRATGAGTVAGSVVTNSATTCGVVRAGAVTTRTGSPGLSPPYTITRAMPSLNISSSNAAPDVVSRLPQSQSPMVVSGNALPPFTMEPAISRTPRAYSESAAARSGRMASPPCRASLMDGSPRPATTRSPRRTPSVTGADDTNVVVKR